MRRLLATDLVDMMTSCLVLLDLPSRTTLTWVLYAKRSDGSCPGMFRLILLLTSKLHSIRSAVDTVKADDSLPPQPPQYTHARTPTRNKKTESLSALAIAISNWLYYPKGKKSVERWNLVVSSLASASVQRTRRTTRDVDIILNGCQRVPRVKDKGSFSGSCRKVR